MTTSRQGERGAASGLGTRGAAVVAGLSALGLTLSAMHGSADSPPVPAPPVLASFDGGSVTLAEYEAAIANKAHVVRVTYAASEKRVHLLRELVDYELLIQEATRRGYADSDAVRVAMLIELTHRLEERVALSIDPAALPEAELRAFYDAHRATLAIAPMRRATYVRFGTRAEAQALFARAKRMSDTEFRDLANGRAKADASSGGELPYVDADGRPGGVPSAKAEDAALVQRVFALPVLGAVAEPFEHGGGFVVLRVTGLTAGAGNRFEDAAEKVREAVAIQRAKQAMAALEQQLRAEHPVEVHPELADQVELDPAPPADIPAGFPAAPPDPRAPTVTVEPDDA
jgi:hypothetical protein